jgi:hypothetical protein
MNGTFSKKLAGGAWIFSTLCAGIFCARAVGAEPPNQTVENRLLLVFDTSAAMKKCLPVTRAAVNQLFLSTLSGQLQAGDTIGVWTFGAGISAGQFPLQTWKPEAAAIIASNINVFVGRQHFGNATKFERLLPLVNNLVQDSERLTVLIFCDGDGQFSSTPYDVAVNNLFTKNQRAAQQAKQPFVIVLRSQRGQYIGCQMSSPPSAITFPDFPPLPRPPPPPAPTNGPPPVPTNLPPPLPPLIIVGTNVGTNLPPPSESKPAPIPTNPPVEVLTNATNLVSAAPTNLVAVSRTNAVAPPENSDVGKKPLIVGGILLAVAGVLIALVVFRARKPARGSLITRSMNQKK